ncbi:MAG: arsenic resistance protein [Firmicutes bacterium]|nr:arsenic resistance protein [Bacillota bacterium]
MASPASGFFNYVKAKLPYLILVSIALGLINGYFNQVSFLKALVTPALFIMIYPMMINLKIEEVFKEIAAPKPLLWSLVVNFLFSPILAFGLAKIFFPDQPMLAVGLLLISLVPTSGMTASWTGLAKGNMKAALVIISANLLLAIVFIPVYLKLFLGKVVVIETIQILRSLLMVVLIPLVLGDLTRRWLVKRKGERGFKEIKPLFSGISSTGVLLIVFVAMSLKSRAILSQPQLVVTTAIPLLLYYLIMAAVSNFIGSRFLSKPDATALVYGTTMRNLTISLGLALNVFQDVPGGGLTVFILAIAYAVQVPLAAFYMKSVLKKQGQL